MMNLKTGQVIGGRYRIARMIGRGGMGVVYAVEDLKLKGALRAMKAAPAATDGTGRHSEEADTLMKLRHPCLPILVDYFPQQAGGAEIMVMDYFEGETVETVLRSTPSGFSLRQIVHIGLQLCSALTYLHSRPLPIIHRDLKPSNVMIDAKGRIKLIDFGISRRYKEGKLQDTARLGTLGFSAPEQYGGRQTDARTDIYGLGALLYYMASGGRPLERQEGKHSTPGSEACLSLPNRFPYEFRRVLERMLQHRPEHRYQTMAEAEEDLKQFAAEELRKDSGGIGWEQHLLRTGPTVVSVLSLSGGAGATLLAITIAVLLGRQGYSVTAAEYDGLQPEWSRLLPDARSGVRNDRVRWVPLHSERLPDDHMSEETMVHRLPSHPGDIQIIDVSGLWQEPQAMHWLKQSRHVFAVADPFMAKWQMSVLLKLQALSRELHDHGGSLHWIANKDVRFDGRGEWLSAFPEQPAAAVPLLPQADMLNAIWGSRWLTDHKRMDGRLSAALKPIISIICDKNNTK